MKKSMLLILIVAAIVAACVVPSLSAYKQEMDLGDVGVIAGGGSSVDIDAETVGGVVTALDKFLKDKNSPLAKWFEDKRNGALLNGSNPPGNPDADISAEVDWQLYETVQGYDYTFSWAVVKENGSSSNPQYTVYVANVDYSPMGIKLNVGDTVDGVVSFTFKKGGNKGLWSLGSAKVLAVNPYEVYLKLDYANMIVKATADTLDGLIKK